MQVIKKMNSLSLNSYASNNSQGKYKNFLKQYQITKQITITIFKHNKVKK